MVASHYLLGKRRRERGREGGTEKKSCWVKRGRGKEAGGKEGSEGGWEWRESEGRI